MIQQRFADVCLSEATVVPMFVCQKQRLYRCLFVRSNGSLISVCQTLRFCRNGQCFNGSTDVCMFATVVLDLRMFQMLYRCLHDRNGFSGFDHHATAVPMFARSQRLCSDGLGCNVSADYCMIATVVMNTTSQRLCCCLHDRNGSVQMNWGAMSLLMFA